MIDDKVTVITFVLTADVAGVPPVSLLTLAWAWAWLPGPSLSLAQTTLSLRWILSMTVQVYNAMTTVQTYSSGMKWVMYVDILFYVLFLQKVIHDKVFVFFTNV